MEVGVDIDCVVLDVFVGMVEIVGGDCCEFFEYCGLGGRFGVV